MIKQNLKNLSYLFLSTLLVYLPIFLNPAVILQRNNDLQEQFWPFFYYIKQQILETGFLPLWNKMIFSGLPLLPDPQFSLFYPPNIFFLIFPTDFAFIFSFVFHTFLGCSGLFFLARYGLNLSNKSSLFSALIYLATPSLVGYLEAGHYGLVATLAWLPFSVLAIIMLIKSPRFLWSILLAVSLAAIFFTHTVTFILAGFASGILFITALLLQLSHKQKFKKIFLVSLAYIITFGLIAVTLLPQLEWMPQTTRFLLLEHPDVYPKWFSKIELFKNVFLPWWPNLSNLWQIETEKWLVLGLTPSLLALVGFWKQQFRIKFIVFFFLIIILLISLNNASPIYSFLISQDWYILMRVSIRVWFIPLILIVILAGFGFETLLKSKLNRKIVALVFIIPILELLFLFWFRLLGPLPSPSVYVSEDIYQYLRQDSDQFRIFCITRCISQQEAAKSNFELIEGYNTLQQKNYYQHMWQLAGGYWNYYSLSLPPDGESKLGKLKPDVKSLGNYNVKYIISPYPLSDKDLNLIKHSGNYFLYKNLQFLPRAYFKDSAEAKAEVTKYTPNFIQVDTSNKISSKLILAEVYSPGWNAYLNGRERVVVQETPISLRAIYIKPDTKFVDFRYEPSSFKIGLIISGMTVLILVLFFLRKKKKI